MTERDEQALPPAPGDEPPRTDPTDPPAPPRRSSRPRAAGRRRQGGADEAEAEATDALGPAEVEGGAAPVGSTPETAEESGRAVGGGRRARARRPSELPDAEAPSADRPRERAAAGRAERASRDRASGDRASGDRVSDDRVSGDRSSGDKSERTGSDRPSEKTADGREVDARFAGGPRPAIHRRAFPAEHLDEDAVRVVKRLARNGFQAYLVGGCVRDLLLGKKPKDFDVATNARPHDLKAIFRNCRVIGRRFRLAHILFGGGKVIETATFRRDPSAGEMESEHDAAEEPLVPRVKSREDDADLLIRHDNVFGEPHEDALRRDFRINGLFYDVERQEVIDFVGGMRDVEARVLSTIGLPDVRFREDPVRILRAIKFSARLDIGIDPECYDAMVAQREELRKAAKARLFEEVLRLLRGGAAHRSVWLAWELGVLAVLLPQVAAMLDDDVGRTRELWRRLDAIDTLAIDGRIPSDTALLCAFLSGAVEEALDGARDALEAYEDLMASVTEQLALPRRIKERMRVVLGCQRRLRSGKIGTLPQREFWRDALDLYEIECVARGVEPTLLSMEGAAVPHVRHGGDDGPAHVVGASSEGSFGDPGHDGRRRRRKRR